MAMKIYLASPLGFNPEHAGYLARIKKKLREQGFAVLDPWEQQEFSAAIGRAKQMAGCCEQLEAFRAIAAGIGLANERLIREADMVLAVLDGLEVDSGTASEVGFGSALGRRCYGLRTDWRDSGDFAGLACNLQVIHFIERTGGRLFRSIDEISINIS